MKISNQNTMANIFNLNVRYNLESWRIKEFYNFTLDNDLIERHLSILT